MNHKTTGMLLKQGWKIAMMHPVWMCAAILCMRISVMPPTRKQLISTSAYLIFWSDKVLLEEWPEV